MTCPCLWYHLLCQSYSLYIHGRKARRSRALRPWLDLIPYNKIIGFGGDYTKPVEKVYGHLKMAQEDIATVLANRVTDGHFDEDEALNIARAWLLDNPSTLYQLGL